MLASGRQALHLERVCGAVALLLCLLHWWLACTAAATKSATFDEPTHFAAGYSYWLRNDYRLDPEAGVLPLRWATLPLLWSRPAFPAADAPAWLSADQGNVGSDFLYRCGNDADALLLRGRAMTAVLSAVLCGTVYLISRNIFGPVGGLLSTVTAACCPTLLGHGALVTADVPAALFFLLAAWSFWRMIDRPTLLRLGGTALATAGLLLSKMSGVVIAPIFLLLIVIRVAVARRRGEPVLRLSGKACAYALMTCLLAIALIWCAYGFRYSSSSSGESSWFAWKAVLQRGTVPTVILSFCRAHQLLPEAYIYGLAYALRAAEIRPAFLDSYWSLRGFADFFPRAFLYKTTIGALALIAAAVGAAICYLRCGRSSLSYHESPLYRAIPVVVLLAVYAATAISSSLNIGYRHFLPATVAVYILVGASSAWLRRGVPLMLQSAVACACALVVGESIAARPNYISCCNTIAGGTTAGYRHLVDSSVDWGQDLPALADWLRHKHNRAGDRVYLSYFGTAAPSHYGIRGTALPLDNLEPLRGGTYCISATVLQQVYSRAMGDWCERYELTYQRLSAALQQSQVVNFQAHKSQQVAALREFEFARLCAALRKRKPSEVINGSIVVFQLSDAEVTEAISGIRPSSVAMAGE